jgi:hypothetical protein
MRHKLALSIVAFIAVAGADVAQASWLDDAWGRDSVRLNGAPAITVHAESVHVVLPVAMLLQAHSEGSTTEIALRDFLERYGQRCSDLLDLNAAHPNLKVRLSLQRPATLTDIDERDAALTLLRDAHLNQPSDDGAPALFTVSPGHLDLTIDYAPKRRAYCISPEAAVPTS